MDYITQQNNNIGAFFQTCKVYNLNKNINFEKKFTEKIRDCSLFWQSQFKYIFMFKTYFIKKKKILLQFFSMFPKIPGGMTRKINNNNDYTIYIQLLASL